MWDTMDSEDMTPPVSPQLSDQQTTRLFSKDFDDVEPLCFVCGGEVANFNDRSPTHSFGPLRRGVLNRLTEQRLQPKESNSPTVELFGFTFPRCFTSVHQVDQFFNIVRQRILQLEQGVKVSDSSGNNESSTLHQRQSIRKVFDHLLLTITCLKKDEGLLIVTKLVENIRNLLLYVGLLCGKSSSRFSNHVTRTGNKSFTPTSHVLHLHIEVWWSCIEVLHAVSLNFQEGLVPFRSLSESRCIEDGSLSDNLDPLSECVQLLLWDFVVLALQQFNTMSLEDIDRASVFPCACVRELFVILIQFLRYRQFQLAKQSFWLILTSVLHQILTDDQRITTDQEMNSDVFSLPPDQAKCQDPVGFCWWMVSNVAPLYQYDQTGSYSSANVPVSDCYGFVQTLIEKCMTSPEVRLRCWLRCVINLVEIWEPNPKLITILWDHFYRKLNDQLLIAESSIASLASISRSASMLLERCQKLTTPDGMNKQENSFFLFLRILHIFLRKSSTGVKLNSEWRQIKGRLFSKFYSRKMQELSETGLHNLSSLFLVLAQTVDLEEVSSKLLELYAMLGTSPEDYIRRQAIWKGTLALCLLCVKRRKDISFLAEKIASLFNEACKELQQSKLSSGSPGELWRLYELYLDGVQDVIDTSEHLDLHEEKLIGDGFHELLMLCRNSELPPILDFLQEIFTKHRIVHKRLLQTGGSTNSLKGMSDCLWKNVYGCVKQRCSLVPSASQHPPPLQMADVAASFTFLAMNFLPGSGCGVGDGFLDCFSYFAWSDEIDVSISCRFMCHMLPNQSVVERMSTNLPEFERKVIRSWFRSSWYVDPASDHMQQFTRHVSKLALFARVFVRANESVPDGEDSSVRFVKAIGRGFNALPMDLQLKAEYRAEVLEYFGEVVKYCNLKESASQDETNRVYCLSGRIVKHCAHLTYVKSNAYCFFPVLLEKLCLPRAVVMGKDLPLCLLPAIKQSLHLFVQGLASLDYKRDPYLKRKLREVIIQYLPRFQRVVEGPTTEKAQGCLVAAFIRTMFAKMENSSCALTSQMATVTSVHPLTKSLSSSFGWTVPEDATVFRQHMFEVVRDEFLGDAKSLNSQDALKALSFLLSVLEKMKSSTEVARDAQILLPISLDRLLMSGNSSERDLSSQLLVLLLDAAKKVPQSSSIQDCIRSVLGTFIGNVTLYQNRVFNVLESVAAIQPLILTDLIPDMTQAIRNLEFKRGVGVDKQLRLHYFNFLSLLGDAGNSEKTRLMQERG